MAKCDQMENKVLVAYAAKHGHTAEIAEKIGRVLKDDGLQVDIINVNKVKDIKQYTAVVVGTATYIATWRREFLRFLAANEKYLATIPVWLFSSGPMGEGDPLEVSQGWRYPENNKAYIDAIKPRDITVFQGAIDLDKMGFFEKWVIKNVKAPVGDFRDWDMITKWANSIALSLK